MRKEGRRGKGGGQKKRKKVEEGRMESERGGGMEEGEGTWFVLLRKEDMMSLPVCLK